MVGNFIVPPQDRVRETGNRDDLVKEPYRRERLCARSSHICTLCEHAVASGPATGDHQPDGERTEDLVVSGHDAGGSRNCGKTAR
jgi:hypothetical protein